MGLQAGYHPGRTCNPGPPTCAPTMPLPFHDQPEQVQPGRRLRRLVGLVALAVPLLAWLAPAGATRTNSTAQDTHGADVTVAVAAARKPKCF